MYAHGGRSRTTVFKGARAPPPPPPLSTRFRSGHARRPIAEADHSPRRVFRALPTIADGVAAVDSRSSGLMLVDDRPTDRPSSCFECPPRETVSSSYSLLSVRPSVSISLSSRLVLHARARASLRTGTRRTRIRSIFLSSSIRTRPGWSNVTLPGTDPAGDTLANTVLV